MRESRDPFHSRAKQQPTRTSRREARWLRPLAQTEGQDRADLGHQEKVSQFLKILADGHYSSECIATLPKIKELCGGSEEAAFVVGRLHLQNKARYVRVAGGDQIELDAFGRAAKYL
ncbi:unnamed protein product [Calypogeia fissa]